MTVGVQWTYKLHHFVNPVLQKRVQPYGKTNKANGTARRKYNRGTISRSL